MKIWTDEPTLGVPPVVTESRISVYPNPASGQTKVSFSTSSPETARILLYNNLGQIVRTETMRDVKAGNNSHTLNLNGLRSGIYSVRVENGNSALNAKVIIADIRSAHSGRTSPLLTFSPKSSEMSVIFFIFA
jgi:hypothetical protein